MSSLLPDQQQQYSDSYKYDDDSDADSDTSYRPTIVIMGQRRSDYAFHLLNIIFFVFRSGKTSIRKVVFQKMSPNETLFVESTARVTDERREFC